MGEMLRNSWYFLVPLIALSIYGTAIIMVKIRWILNNRIKPNHREDLYESVQEGHLKQAYETLPHGGIERKIIGKAVMILQKGRRDNLGEELMESGRRWMAPFVQDLSNFSFLANISTLMGLLGTIIGMIFAFYKLLETGESNPYVLAGGISQALITTAAGLLIAIPFMLSQLLFRRWAQRKEEELLQLIHLFKRYGHREK